MLFNGMGPTPPGLLATVLAYDDRARDPGGERSLFRVPAPRSRPEHVVDGYRQPAAA